MIILTSPHYTLCNVYSEVYDMRTNIVLDDELVEEAFKYSDSKTKKELINTVLDEYIINHREKNLLEIKGKITFAKDYDHKKMREGK